MFSRIDDEILFAHRLDAVAYGENADDALRVDRPGARAAVEHRVLRPLADLRLRKADVRKLARAMELPSRRQARGPVSGLPDPPLRARDAGEVAPDRPAEAALADLGLREFRVRHHGDLARIELSSDELSAALRDPLRGQVEAAVRAAGFADVMIDPAGLQSGRFTLTVLQDQRA